MTGKPASGAHRALLVGATLLAGDLTGCAKPGEASGTLTSGDDGEPIGGVGVLALGDSRDADCARRETTTDEDGDFAFAALCPHTDYHFVPEDPSWWAPSPPRADGAAATTGVALVARRVPPADGAWLLHGRSLTAVPADSHLDAVDPPSPTSLPAEPPRVGPGDRLLLVGDAWAAAPVRPVVPTAGTSPWFALGTAVTATDSERLTGPPPPGDQLTSAGSAESSATRAVLSVRALPAGTYAIAPADRPWAAIVRFGESTPAD